MVVLVLARVLDLLLCLPHFVEILETTLIHAMAVIIQSLLGVTDDLRSEPGSILLQPVRAPPDPTWSCMHLCSANWFCVNLNLVALDPLSWFPSTMRLESNDLLFISVLSNLLTSYWIEQFLPNTCYYWESMLCLPSAILHITQYIKQGSQKAVSDLEQDGQLSNSNQLVKLYSRSFRRLWSFWLWEPSTG